MGKKFVGLGGLKHFWTKAKTWIAGQITSEVTAKIAEIVANAPEDLDTLKEIADWISTHVNDASAMNTQINTNKNDIAALQTSVAGKAAASHTHDDRYYTESEVDKKLAGKSNVEHTHTKSEITDFAHTHDDRYYTESEVDKKLAGKSDTGHTHTKSQITDFPTSLPANGGTADTATGINYTGESGGCISAQQTSKSFNNSSADWASYIICNHGNGTTYYHQMLRLLFFSDTIQLQRRVNGELKGWKNVAIMENENDWSGRQNFSTARAVSKMVIPIGAPSSLEDGCIWIQ